MPQILPSSSLVDTTILWITPSTHMTTATQPTSQSFGTQLRDTDPTTTTPGERFAFFPNRRKKRSTSFRFFKKGPLID